MGRRSKTIFVAVGNRKKVKSQTNIRGITLRQQLPAMETDKLYLRLSVENFPEYNSDYTLIYRRKSFTAFRTHVMNLTE